MAEYNRVKDLSKEPWVDRNTFHIVLYRLHDNVYLTRNAISGAVEEVICDEYGSPLRYGDVVYETGRSIPLTRRITGTQPRSVVSRRSLA